jgi:hypothetical protein
MHIYHRKEQKIKDFKTMSLRETLVLREMELPHKYGT